MPSTSKREVVPDIHAGGLLLPPAKLLGARPYTSCHFVAVVAKRWTTGQFTPSSSSGRHVLHVFTGYTWVYGYTMVDGMNPTTTAIVLQNVFFDALQWSSPPVAMARCAMAT